MRDHRTGYDRYATDRCERALLTLLGEVVQAFDDQGGMSK